MTYAGNLTPARQPPLRVLLRLFALSGLLLAGEVTRAASEGPRWFDIAGGDALATLRTFAAQAGGRLLYSVDLVSGTRTQPVHGEMSPTAALRLMLLETDLEPARDTRTGALVIRRRQTAPAAASSKNAAPATDKPVPNEELIRLPTFELRSEHNPRYVGSQATSTTRIGSDLADLPQSVRVLNKAFLTDVNPTILAKALNYVGGAQTGTINWSVDRYMIRGFVGEGDYVDGFRTQTDRNTDLNIIDHIDVIKGPAAIFVANQSLTVGGVINKVSKSPTDYHVGTATLEIGAWDANRADIDVGGPATADGRLMWRFLSAAQDTRGYYDNTYEKRTSVLPMLGYRFSDDTEAWIKFETFDSHYSSYNGIPLDGRTNQIAAVPYRTNFSENTPLNWRTDWFTRWWGQFVTHASDLLAIRVAAFDSVDHQRRVESILGSSGTTTPTQQPDGSYAFLPYAQYVIPPTYQRGQAIARTVTAINDDWQPRREIQNDYVFTTSTGPVSHKLLLGADLISYPETTRTYSSGPLSTAAASPIDPFAAPHPGSVAIAFTQPPVNETDRTQAFAKAYALETAGFFHDHLIVSLGASRNRFALSMRSRNFDQTSGTPLPDTAVPQTSLYKNLVQFGVVLKPATGVSLFYGSNENFSANPIQLGQFLPPQRGVQHEIGVKSTWLGGTLEFSISGFEVTQHNNSVPAFPQTTPPGFVLVPGTTSRGWDGDLTLEVNRRLNIVGSFAWYQARVPLPTPWNLTPQPYDGRIYSKLPVNNAAEHSAGLWAHYRFAAAPGLSAALGASYFSRRAITDNSNLVFYGFIPPRTLVDAMLTYQWRRCRLQLNVDNALNAHYIFAVRSDQVLVPGTPLNARLSLTVRF